MEDHSVISPLGDVGSINALSATMTQWKEKGLLSSYSFYFTDNRDLSVGDFASDIEHMLQEYKAGHSEDMTDKVLRGEV